MKYLIEGFVAMVSLIVIVAMVYFKAPWFATALVVLLIAFGWFFYVLVLPRIIAARAVLAVPQVSNAQKQDGLVLSSWWTWLFGFKGQLCYIGAVLLEAIPQLIDKLMGVDLSAAFGPKIGALASISLIGLGAFFHADGLHKAANATPAGTGEDDAAS